MEKGMTKTTTETVTADKLASQIGSGGLDVYATPSMILLMEKTCYACVQEQLEDGQSTVGTLVNVAHKSATPEGMEITCTATLEEIDGRRLVFSVTASDEAGIIGEGTHERFIIDKERFMSKTKAKAK